ATVDLQARNVHAETGVEGGDAAEGRSLTVGGGLAEEDVVDVGTGDTGAGDEFADDGGREILGGDVPQDTAEPAHRGAQGFADHYVGHDVPRSGLFTGGSG